MTETEKLVAHIRLTLGDLNVPQPQGEYQYSAIPLCIIDAVFSLGVRYESTWRTVCNWCARYGWEKERTLAPAEHTVDDFLQILNPYVGRWEEMADKVFCNRQRTSTTSGILKAEAVYRFSQTLQLFSVQTFDDVLNNGLRADLRHAIAEIPGQGSGLSFNYFLILAGNQNAVKADRMVTRFVADALNVRNVKPELCERLVREASGVLRPDFPRLVPSLLDHAIWRYQRSQGESGPSNARHTLSG